MPLHEKVWVLAKSLWLFVFYKFFHVMGKGDSWSAEKRDDVVVSLTTYGRRLSSVHLTVYSLLRQSVCPSSIYLWLYQGDIPKEGLPAALKALEKKGLTIRIVGENLRSYKKIVHTFELAETRGCRFVVTADDDVYYPKWWLERLLEKAESNPDFVWCYRGHIIEFVGNGELKPYREWALADRQRVCGNNLLPVGVSGVCYPIESLKGVNDRDRFLSLAPTADDLWLKCVTTSNGYSARLVKDQSVHFVPVVTSLRPPEKGLEKVNVLEDGNTRTLSLLMRHFGFGSEDFV
ncbi:glycosyltransferase [Marinobacter sp. TBZ242]|uniref:Glycosyltransferase n=1 Tax=Marinobacter azerbaijanicus TaxID=3050455 RepID=A0ABT7I7M7_9GAMM|nr:glycosyltransferase [Marinobacter sp. TBZ242]MDL0430161.1 glycosyltransferase [Marinobacter sp. TBZ242]